MYAETPCKSQSLPLKLRALRELPAHTWSVAPLTRYAELQQRSTRYIHAHLLPSTPCSPNPFVSTLAALATVVVTLAVVVTLVTLAVAVAVA